MIAALEHQVQAAIIEAFRLKFRIRLWRTDAGGAGMRSGASKGFRGYTGMPVGFPDLTGVVPPNGRAIFIECKRPGGKPTPAQLAFLAGLKAEGAIAFWSDSVNSAIQQFEEAA